MTYYSYAHEIYPSQRPMQRPAPQTLPIQQSPPTYTASINQPYSAGTQEHASFGDDQPASSRSFLIKINGLWKPGLTIMSPDGVTPLYQVQRHQSRRPHVTITTPSAPDIVIGAATLHAFSSRIDLQVRNQSFTLRRRGFFKAGLYYASPAWNGATLIWKQKSFLSRQLVCLYEGGVFVAKLKSSLGSFRKIGELEVDENAMQRAPGGETAVIEEAMMVVLALIEVGRRRKNNSGGMGSAGMGAAGGGGCDAGGCG